LKLSSLARSGAAVALLTAAVFAITTIAQTPQVPPPAPGSVLSSEPNHAHAAPTNLKVLPKNLTGDQVREIMEGWEAALGTHCSTCHAADPNNIGPNGRPRLNYADDSKPEKATARLMYTMAEDINVNYLSKIESSGVPITCGTCHRGHLAPEPFTSLDEDHPPSRQSTPPGGTTPSQIQQRPARNP
jgi:photosynthetic reaction center cytochrome c subunit